MRGLGPRLAHSWLREDARIMMTTDLGACEWFVWDLRRSNLIDRGHLDQIVGEFLSRHPGAEPPALAEFLIEQGILTQFQAERLLQGKTQGFVLGPYTLMDALGTGSMGTVYKALSKNDNQWYAVKVLPRRSMWNVRIARRKVRSFEQVQHPAVVPFVDVGTAGGMHYLAWPLVEGESLDRIVQRDGPLTAEQAARLALQVTEGLDICHRHELFHGLLKPSNLLIGPDGQVRILDFGIGCLLAETEGESLVDTMSTANSVSSGLDCASPESIMDPTNLNPTGDQYSLGCVLYFCLTGRVPFPEGTAVEKMMAHQHKQPTPIRELNPEAPEELTALVERLMEKQPAHRFPSTSDVADALRAVLGEAPVPTPPAPRTTANGLAGRPPAAAAPRPSFSNLPKPPSAHGTPRPPAMGPTSPSRTFNDTPPPARPVPGAPSRSIGPGMGLPTRQSMQQFAPPTQMAMPQPQPQPQPVQRVPTQVTDPDEQPRTWEERLGPIGIAVCAVLACVLVWFLTYKLF